MEVASSILILTFGVYLNFVGCNPAQTQENWRPDVISSNPSQWIPMKSHGYDVEVKRDLRYGTLMDIRLKGGQSNIPTSNYRNCQLIKDYENHLLFVAILKTNSKWMAVAPMSKEFMYDVYHPRPSYLHPQHHPDLRPPGRTPAHPLDAWRPGPFPASRPECVPMRTHGYDVEVMRDPYHGTLIDIRLKGGQPPIQSSRVAKLINDFEQHLQFVAKLDIYNNYRWMAVAPFSEEFRYDVNRPTAKHNPKYHDLLRERYQRLN